MENFQTIKERVSIGDLVEDAGVKLSGRGKVRQGKCPFHDENEGSFTVYEDSQRFYCFGCNAAGDVIDFISRLERLSMPQAIDRLASVPFHPSRQPLPSNPHARAQPMERDPRLLTAVARWYAAQLAGEEGQPGRDYLWSRGITVGTARRLGLGFCPGAGLVEAMKGEGYKRAKLREAGLLSGLPGKEVERFVGHVVVPEVSGGRVWWMVGRALAPEALPRFQALPGAKPVLGLAALGPTLSWVVVAEGLFDYLTLVQWGYPACAVLGTHGLERVAAALPKASRVVLAFDSDKGGQEATAGLKELLGARGYMLKLPPGVGDVAELALLQEGRRIFRTALAGACKTREVRR